MEALDLVGAHLLLEAELVGGNQRVVELADEAVEGLHGGAVARDASKLLRAFGGASRRWHFCSVLGSSLDSMCAANASPRDPLPAACSKDDRFNYYTVQRVIRPKT